ncbi:broad specificity phosphatase PhoE [Polynucleobacter sphagniphilus]|uniref:histidine phosphatase family protein n=1 Tax=Polynucleobacter sphagniphilus TaxID=1743169 RepID=UPI002473E732|nr:histidine phosphatase family protein [Polynucleobacter sphagniphilus]MDH6420909.1 broad specificity phosphatase PhoE [Polynucleobacter sphagniphilus]
MQIYLLRHGHSLANAMNLVCGSMDFELSDLGRVEAEIVSNKLSQVKFTKIYSSPLARAVATIRTLKSEVSATLCPELQECDNGHVSLLTLSDLWDREPRFKKPWLSPSLRYPGGECFSEMVDRITGWFMVASKNWSDEDIILIVGHHGTVKSIFMHLSHLTLADYPDFPLGNCDYIEFNLNQGVVVEKKHFIFKGFSE